MPSDKTNCPRQVNGWWVWSAGDGAVEVWFVGRGPSGGRRDALGAVADGELGLAWLRQVHSARVVSAESGACGEGDALVTRQAGLALSVATADCVPVVVAGGDRVAAVHAGWRGIAEGVVAAALHRLGGDPGTLTAWIGPAIGPCCYEVGGDVAERVAGASHAAVVKARATGRPHLDLPAAATHQLAAGGIERVQHIEACTRCSTGELWSYRREGRGAGRNYTFAWLRPGTT